MSDTIQTPDEGTELQDQVTPQADPEIETPQTPDEVVETPAAEPTTEQTPSEPEPQDPYKKKFVDSAREGILLNERVKVRDARLETLTKQDTPTDEAMRKLYPEWDNLDDYNKRVLIRQETNAMRQARLEAQQQEILDRQKLDDELEDVIDNTPKLKGREAEFKRFAKQKKNLGIPAETLAKAFLYEPDEEAPAPQPEPLPKEALPVGSGGPRGDLKPKKISLEEAAHIRKTDSKRYKELVMAGQIEELE